MKKKTKKKAPQKMIINPLTIDRISINKINYLTQSGKNQIKKIKIIMIEAVMIIGRTRLILVMNLFLRVSNRFFQSQKNQESQ